MSHKLENMIRGARKSHKIRLEDCKRIKNKKLKRKHLKVTGAIIIVVRYFYEARYL